MPGSSAVAVSLEIKFYIVATIQITTIVYRGSMVLVVARVGRCLTPRELGGLGSMKLPLLADFSKKMARDFGVLVEDEGIALRYTSDKTPLKY